MAAVPLDNPHTALIAWYHFQRRNAATGAEKLKQLIIGLAGSLVVLTLVEALFDVNIIQTNKHPGMQAFDNAGRGHFFKRVCHVDFSLMLPVNGEKSCFLPVSP